MAGMLLMALAAVARHTAMLYREEPLQDGGVDEAVAQLRRSAGGVPSSIST